MKGVSIIAEENPALVEEYIASGFYSKWNDKKTQQVRKRAQLRDLTRVERDNCEAMRDDTTLG